MIPIRLSSRSRPAVTDELLRVAIALARAEGWQAEGPPVDDIGGGVSVVVTGDGLAEPALLRVRERRPGERPTDSDLPARRAAASEHVLGVVRGLDGRQVRGREVDAVLLAHAPGGSLEALLARDDVLSGGEAATVLLGVTAGVAALHAASWANPTLTAAGVVFAADGCPALAQLDGVRPIDAGAAVADAEAFHRLARSVCLRVADRTGMRLLAAVERGLRTGRWSAVEQAIVSATAPEPVRIADAGAVSRRSPGVVIPSRGVKKRQSTGAVPLRSGAGSSEGAITPRTVGRNAASLLAFLDGQPIRDLARRLLVVVRRRPALAVVAALPIAAALTLAVLPPAGDPAVAADHVGANRRSESGSGGDSSSSTGHAGDRRPPQSQGSSDSGHASKTEPGVVAGATRPPAKQSPDDPVDAARALLEARHRCFAVTTAAATCLDAVLDSGAGLREDESSALGSPGAAEARDYAGAGLTLAERWGDAALVAAVPDHTRTPKSEPASLLLVRSETGWRLRAVFP